LKATILSRTQGDSTLIPIYDFDIFDPKIT
jgi:hypothetical protein